VSALKKLVLPLAALLLLAGVTATAVAVSSYIHQTSRQPVAAAVCTAPGATYNVTIRHDKLSQTAISGRLCDRLTITNQDDRLRLIAFGIHTHHQAYDGVTEKLLQRGQSLTITFDRPGEYTFHDHLQDSVIGYFTVSR
jgi:hypothetical protein